MDGEAGAPDMLHRWRAQCSSRLRGARGAGKLVALAHEATLLRWAQSGRSSIDAICCHFSAITLGRGAPALPSLHTACSGETQVSVERRALGKIRELG